MIRHTLAVVVVLVLSPAWLYAQNAELTVNIASADVHKSPSSGSPVIGKAPRGTVLEVTRELGSWVKVSWPGVQDGAGYVHVNSGSIAGRSVSDPKRAAIFNSRPAPDAAVTRTSAPVDNTATAAQKQALPQRTAYVPTPTHTIGLGGRLGGTTLGFGASARAWSQGPIGIQLEVARYAHTDGTLPDRVTSIQFAPSVLYSLPDSVGGAVWLRPYLGAGLDVYRLRMSNPIPSADSVTGNRWGVLAFGGGELTFANVPQFALSADLGYHWAKTPFLGVELGGLGLSVSGHWYVK
jgi:Bacterial SH3 domain